MAKRQRGVAPRLIVDPAHLRLDHGDIVFKHTADGGYLCIGFGSGASLLRAIDDGAEAQSRREQACAKIASPTADPFLTELRAAVALAKAGFDPEQTRDEDGRWTSGGAGAASEDSSASDNSGTTNGSGVGGSGASTALAGFAVGERAGGSALDLFSGELAPTTMEALQGLASRLSAPTAFFGTLLIPSNRSLISEGTLPDAPDLRYCFDQGTGRLKLTRDYGDGLSQVLYSERYGLDGVFRDSNGNAIGRHFGGTLVLDAEALPGRRVRDEDQPSGVAGPDAAPKPDKPRLCPDPGSDKPGWESRSERSLKYQEDITGLPRGLAVELSGVSFDGCRERDGVMLEAKGPGYLEFMDGPDDWKYWYIASGKFGELLGQMQKQADVAKLNGRRVEWHIAEKPVADNLAEYARKKKFRNLKVIFDPRKDK